MLLRAVASHRTRVIKAPHKASHKDAPLDAAPVPQIWRLIFWVCAVMSLVALGCSSTSPSGDWREYLSVLRAWHNHFSPDVRPSDTMLPLWDAARSEHFGVFRSPRTQLVFGQHFWLYPLACLPAKALLRAMGGNEMAAFQVTNGLLLAGALDAALFASVRTGRERLIIVALCTATCTLLYLRWMGPEIWSWSLVLVALTLFDKRRYVAASACAALAATQNPPLLFFAFWIALASARERNARLSIAALGAAALSLAPSAFYKFYFGHPSLIVASGLADRHWISLARTGGFFADLNQGMMVFVPLLLMLGAVGWWRAARNRDWLGCSVAIPLLLMILSSEATANWNSGALGMLRYAIWMLPLFAWIATRALPVGPQWRRNFGAVAVLHLLLALNENWFQEHGPLASWMLQRAPAFYNPDPEIFTDRTLHVDTLSGQTAALTPIVYFAPDGHPTKVLTDAASLPRLRRNFRVALWYQDDLQRFESQKGLFYFNPPLGALVRLKQQPSP